MKNLLLFLFLLLSLCQCGKKARKKITTDTPAPVETKAKEKLDSVSNIEAPIFKNLPVLTLQLRIVEILRPNSVALPISKLYKCVNILNENYAPVKIKFVLQRQEYLYQNLTLPDLQAGNYEEYFNFSSTNDVPDMITLYLVDNADDLCEGNSCYRAHGFALILSESANNIVLDKFFIDDDKTIVHEFGHYFGLFHTFDTEFGKEKVSGENCATAGDRICDTPADPGEQYSIYINPTTCEMAQHKEDSTGAEYKPLINNFMAYYKPCYLKKYTFTNGQLEVIRNVAATFRRKVLVANF